MTSLQPEIAAEVRSACQAGQEEISQALQRALDATFELMVGEAGEMNVDNLPQELSGPALIFVFQIGEQAALAVLSESSGLVPTWCAEPDAVDQGKLQTLALELGATLFPAALATQNCTFAYVRDVAAALRSARVSASAVALAIALKSGEKRGNLTLLWPAAEAGALLARDQPLPSVTHLEGAAQPAPVNPTTQPLPPPPPRRNVYYGDLEEGIRLLPPYSRSLLRIRVAVTVTLAESKQPLKTVLNIGTGSIIHFNKSCDDTLTLEVAGHKVAVGETVKVGDKFGLWITSMIMPNERFWVISSRQQAERAK